MTPLRTAIIGCGQFAHRHAQRLAALDDIQLVGFCNHHIEKAVAFNEEYAGGRAQVYEDYARMYQELDLDLVYIILPPFAHGNEVELACEHGVHLFIEKPIALTLEKAKSMAEAVKSSGVKSQVGYLMRFGEAVQRLKSLAQAGGPNPSGLLSATYSCNSLHAPWWRNKSKSGGQLFEQLTHLFDLARFFFGEPALVYAMQENMFHRDMADYTVDDASGTIIRFQSGAMAVISASNGAIPNRWDYQMRVVLSQITADIENANHAVFHHTDRDWPATTTIVSEKDILLAETLDLLAAIREDRPTAIPMEEGLKTLLLGIAAIQSAEQGQPVEMSSFGM